MILLLLLNLVTGLVDSLFSILGDFLELTGLDLDAFLVEFMKIIDKGCSMFYFLFGPVATVLATYIAALVVVKHAWDIIWFVIRKIPILNIRE